MQVSCAKNGTEMRFRVWGGFSAAGWTCAPEFLAEQAIAVLQLLQSEAATAKWLFHQEKATFHDARNATHKLENRSSLPRGHPSA